VRYRVVVTVIGASIILSSCATPYQPEGLTGGYKDFEINKNTYQVLFRGNGWTSASVVRRYVLRRAAELTLQNHYKYFLVLNGHTGEKDSAIQTPTTINSYSNDSYNGNIYGGNYSGYGYSNSYATINPGSTYEIKKYRTSATIRMLHSNKGYLNALDPKIILRNFKENE